MGEGNTIGLAAFFTYKISHGLENKREEKNKKDQIDFNIRVVQLISSETQYYIEILQKYERCNRGFGKEEVR